MPTVVMVGQSIQPRPPLSEAIQNQCYQLASRLRRSGWSVAYLSRTTNKLPSIRRVDGMWVVCLPSSAHPLLARFWSAIGLLLIMVGWRPEVVHFWGIHSLLPVPHVFFAGRPRRLLVTVYRPVNSGRECEQLARMVDWPLDVVVEDPSLVSSVRRMGAQRVTIVPPGVDTSQLLPRKRPHNRRSWFAYFASAPIGKKGKDEEPYLQSRGVQLGIDLCERVAGRVAIELVLLWRTDVSAQVRQMTAAAPHATVVRTVIPNLAGYVDRFDLCFILSDVSTRSKAIPLSALEALAIGIPVVVRHGTPLAAKVERAGAGFVVHEDALDAAASAIDAVLKNASRYAAMSSQARQLACECFDLDRTVSAYQRVYRSALCTSA